MSRSIFSPPEWGPPSTISLPRTRTLHGDWEQIAELEQAEHGDRLVWIAKHTRSGSDDGPETFRYRVIVRP